MFCAALSEKTKDLCESLSQQDSSVASSPCKKQHNYCEHWYQEKPGLLDVRDKTNCNLSG